MQLLDLYAGRAFRMGKGSNWRIVHPEMGARRHALDGIVRTTDTVVAIELANGLQIQPPW